MPVIPGHEFSGEIAALGAGVRGVGVGDLVLIPPATDHGIENDGEEDLVYVTAASPPVSMQELYENELAEVAGYGLEAGFFYAT